MDLEKILKKYGIPLRDQEGNIRNVVDVLEDFYLKVSASEYNKIMYEVSEEEKYYNIFDDARNRKYKENI